MVNIMALLTPILPLVAVPEYMFTFMGQWTYTACINATVTVILTTYMQHFSMNSLGNDTTSCLLYHTKGVANVPSHTP